MSVEKHLKKINNSKMNKIKSIKEILDLNKDGTVSKEEYVKGLNNGNVMNEIEDLSPLEFMLMQNNMDSKTLNNSLKIHNDVKLVKNSFSNSMKDVNFFNTYYKN